MKRDKKTEKISADTPVLGDACDTADILNKYGTYNIQPTSDTENLFPGVSQGLPKKHKKEK